MPATSSASPAAVRPRLEAWPVPAAWRMDAAPAYRIQYADGSSDTSGETQPRFTIVTTGRKQWRCILHARLYSAASAFINGGFDVEGDLPAAIRFYTSAQPRRWRDTLWALLARFGRHRLESWVQRRTRAATNVRCHYDRSNEFYSRFLDRNMVYSCAYFERPGMPLEQAQTAKLELICRKLDLRPHYALTCRAWVERLQQNRDECLRTADSATYRTWLLYLAGSAVSFEDGLLNVAQLLLAKRSSPTRRMTRDYMYAPLSASAAAHG